MTHAEERIGEARRGILAEFESSGDVDTRKWLALYPDVAMDVLDFIVWIEAEEVPRGATWVDDGGVAEAAFRAAFDQVKSAQLADLHQLSSQLHEIRSLAQAPASRRAPLQFQRAAVYAWTVAHLHDRRRRVSRLAAQKSVYVLEHALDLHLFEEHQRMRLGPYDSTARYKDAEPIARQKLWVEAEGSALRPGEKVAEADRYAERYLRSREAAVRLLEVLALLTDDELETFATVQAVVAEMRKESVEVGVRSVKERIADIPEWAGKLTRRNFNDRDVAVALQRLTVLGLDQPGR
ncbi:MAG TPA: hypothetical protein VF710_23465 [Longimicrobium sp.]|jgi:hypothetical protein